MKSKFAMLAAAGLTLVMGHTASAAVVYSFGFDNAGQPDGWNLVNAARSVNGNGYLRGNSTSNDPQMTRAIADEFTRTAGSTAWSELVVVVSEYDAPSNNPGDAGNLVTSSDTTGVVAILNAVNFGVPATSAIDANGFITLTWDISSLASTTTGGIRIDPVGGPLTSGGSFFVDSITLTDNAVIPEPASLALLGLGGLAMLGRRRK